MSKFTSIQTKKIYSIWIYGRILPFPILVGVRYFPITYKGSKFVVELKANFTYCRSGKDIEYWARCYEYMEEKKLFRGHKGKFVFSCNVTYIALDDQTIIDIRNLRESGVNITTKQLMEKVFLAYEDKKQKEAEKQRIIAEDEAWDGIVS